MASLRAIGGILVLALLATPAISSAQDNPITPTPPPFPANCLSTTLTCITSLPFEISRTDSIEMRAYSVTFTLTANLALCSGVASISEGTYLSSVGTTLFQITDNGGGSYTVDCSILGEPCGALAASGTLFNIEVQRVAPVTVGMGTITVTATDLRDCSNAAIPGSTGQTGTVQIDRIGPVAVNDCASSQVKSGNDADGTSQVTVTFTVPGDAAITEVYRAGYGDYPEYDDGAGAVPSAPSYPPGAPWALTAVTATGQTDEVASRDYWYYTVFTFDACGNVSSVSNLSNGTLNYHLGDFHDGSTNCAGENTVDISDLSFLGANYGISLGATDPLACLDVGPTSDASVDGLPTTDDQIQFEDLLMFAINYQQVSKDAPLAAAVDELEVRVADGNAAVGDVIAVDLMASGTGQVQGLSTRLAWDGAVVEPIDVDTGELMVENGGVVFSPEPGVIDAAVLGAGRGLAGEGVLATAKFRVIGTGDPAIEVAEVDARDTRNQPVSLGVALTRPESPIAQPGIELLPNTPNPFGAFTNVAFRLGAPGEVEVSVYAIDGRRVRTLARGFQTAGAHELTWDGRDDRGADVSSGIYYLRLQSAEGTQSRTVTLVR